MAHKVKMNHGYDQTDSVSGRVIPATSGDRYWAQDMAKDMLYMRSMIGEVMASFLKQESTLLYTGVTPGSDNTHVNVAESAGIAQIPVITADDGAAFAMPQQTKTVNIDVLVKCPQTLGLVLPGTDGFVKMRYVEQDAQTRTRHYTGGSYPYAKTETAEVVAGPTDANPMAGEVLLATYSGAGTADFTVVQQLSYRDKTDRRLNNLEAVGGYLNAYDFGTAVPTQDELTEYALSQIPHATVPEDIFNGTRVKNLFNNHLWIFSNGGGVYDWADNGIDPTGAVATNSTFGIVIGEASSTTGKAAVTADGHIQVPIATTNAPGVVKLSPYREDDDTTNVSLALNSNHGLYPDIITTVTTYTVPSGVRMIYATLVGGGGGGGGGSAGLGTRAGNGGAAGEVIHVLVPCKPNDILACAVGNGGASNTNGEDTVMKNLRTGEVYIARGGKTGGNGSTCYGGGMGGAPNASVYAGGGGGAGASDCAMYGLDGEKADTIGGLGGGKINGTIWNHFMYPMYGGGGGGGGTGGRGGAGGGVNGGGYNDLSGYGNSYGGGNKTVSGNVKSANGGGGGGGATGTSGGFGGGGGSGYMGYTTAVAGSNGSNETGGAGGAGGGGGGGGGAGASLTSVGGTGGRGVIFFSW